MRSPMLPAPAVIITVLLLAAVFPGARHAGCAAQDTPDATSDEPAPATPQPPPPPPTYAREVAVIPSLLTYSEALAAAREWRNSTLFVVRDEAMNEEARQALVDEGRQRAWIGAYRDAALNRFVWLDGVEVGGSTRPFTNWAPDRPVAGDTASTAIAIDMASGLWFDLAQGTPNAAVVDTPSREVTETLPLPPFEFPPGVPPKPKTPAWQTGIVVGFSILTVVVIAVNVAVCSWHWRTPIRVDNKEGFVAELVDAPAPAVAAAGGEKPSQDTAKPRSPSAGGRGVDVAEPFRRSDDDYIRKTQEQLGKPLREFDQPPADSADSGVKSGDKKGSSKDDDKKDAKDSKDSKKSKVSQKDETKSADKKRDDRPRESSSRRDRHDDRRSSVDSRSDATGAYSDDDSRRGSRRAHHGDTRRRGSDRRDDRSRRSYSGSSHGSRSDGSRYSRRRSRYSDEDDSRSWSRRGSSGSRYSDDDDSRSRYSRDSYSRSDDDGDRRSRTPSEDRRPRRSDPPREADKTAGKPAPSNKPIEAPKSKPNPKPSGAVPPPAKRRELPPSQAATKQPAAAPKRTVPKSAPVVGGPKKPAGSAAGAASGRKASPSGMVGSPRKLPPAKTATAAKVPAARKLPPPRAV